MSAAMTAATEAVGWTLVHFVWQGALIGAAAALLLVLLRRAPATQRYLVACVALLMCAAWPVAGLVLRLSAPASPALGADSAASAANLSTLAALAGFGAGWPALLRAHLGGVVVFWLACIVVLCGRSALGLLWIGRAARDGGIDAAWQARLSLMAQRFGIGRPVRLRIVNTLASPMTAGWWRPVVLVPGALVTGMPPDLLEALLAHELAHVRRHDYLVNLLQNAIEILLFYHPVVWWLSRRIRSERELIADDLAASQSGEPRRLALALSELEKLQFSHHHLALGADGGDLMKRIKQLLQPQPVASNWKAVIGVLALAAACGANVANARIDADAPPHAAPAPKHEDRAMVDFKTCSKPAWSKPDLEAGHTGTVVLGFLISAQGEVLQSTIRKSSGYPGLDKAAESGISKCRFKPAKVDGKPVESWMQMIYVWQLHD
jgi:D-alanyl-D-alanine endopeptidase (penicillin-binding protein 7)